MHNLPVLAWELGLRWMLILLGVRGCFCSKLLIFVVSATRTQQYIYLSTKPFWNIANGCPLVKYQGQS